MIEKTAEMERIEFRDWQARRLVDASAEPRDIREIIQAAFDEAGRIEGAAEIVGVTPSTLSVWINHKLEGDVKSRAVFPKFQPSPDLAEVVA